MAREIKFRGKYTLPFHEVGKPVVSFWVYGSLIMCCDKTDIVESDGNIRQDINPQTIGQFTGLHDKNGKEIYEGDIVHLDAWSPYAMQIVFLEGAFCLADKEGHFLGDIHYIHHAEVEQCTILGNIYDNPELLTKEA